MRGDRGLRPFVLPSASSASSASKLRAAAILLAVTACSTPAYAPCPLDLQHALPDDAFARCREVLLANYDYLETADEPGFRLQTAWQPTREPPGERRATIYRESLSPPSLAIVVEQRWLEVPWFGPPGWTSARGDARAERELREQLRDALAPGP